LLRAFRWFNDTASDYLALLSLSSGSKDRQKFDGGRGGKLKSDTIFAGERRYYMDLKENGRGRFLKVGSHQNVVWHKERALGYV